MKCKVCNKDLYNELDYRTLFRWKYTIHESCRIELNIDVKVEAIPIENNTILSLYFYDYPVAINSDYMEMRLFEKALRFCLENKGWSIVFWMPLNAFQDLDAITQYFMIKLSDQSLVFLSLVRNMWQFLKSYIEFYVSKKKKCEYVV